MSDNCYMENKVLVQFYYRTRTMSADTEVE